MAFNIFLRHDRLQLFRKFGEIVEKMILKNRAGAAEFKRQFAAADRNQLGGFRRQGVAVAGRERESGAGN